MQNSWKEYFIFNKKERIGIILLITLIALCIALPYFFTGSPEVPDKALLEKLTRQLAELNHVHADSEQTSSSPYSALHYNNAPNKNSLLFPFNPNTKSPPPFPFNPNTLSDEGWLKLGLKEKNVLTIRHYLARGGQFRNPSDLLKIYGIPQELAQRLIPFVILPAPEPRQPAQQQMPARDSMVNNYHIRPPIKEVDINADDTAAWIALPGIGPGFTHRIINFRNKLGGFYAIDQVGETWGLPDSTFQVIRKWLVCPQRNLKTINMNTSDVATLSSHPYIRWRLANAIVQYRQQHGPYKDLQELLKIDVINPEIFKKIAPYLALE